MANKKMRIVTLMREIIEAQNKLSKFCDGDPDYDFVDKIKSIKDEFSIDKIAFATFTNIIITRQAINFLEQVMYNTDLPYIKLSKLVGKEILDNMSNDLTSLLLECLHNFAQIYDGEQK